MFNSQASVGSLQEQVSDHDDCITQLEAAVMALAQESVSLRGKLDDMEGLVMKK